MDRYGLLFALVVALVLALCAGFWVFIFAELGDKAPIVFAICTLLALRSNR